MVKQHAHGLTPDRWPLVTPIKIRPGGLPPFRATVILQGIRYSDSSKIMLAQPGGEILLSAERSELRLHLLVLNEMGGGRVHDYGRYDIALVMLYDLIPSILFPLCFPYNFLPV